LNTENQATYDNITLHREDTNCMLDNQDKNTDTNSQYYMLIAFPFNGYGKALQWYVVPTLPVVLFRN